MKLDQIAYYAHDEHQVLELKSSFGLQDSEWIEDVASGTVKTGIDSGRSEGLLRFNYDLGIELEILTYLSGPHWHEQRPEYREGSTFLSHIGFHMDEGEEVPEEVKTKGWLAQIMDTDSHTNDYIVSRKRTYHYEIYGMPSGPDRKYIWRIEK